MTLLTNISRYAVQVETHRLGMAECGYRGLSENWLLKRLGDVHWQLIAEALGQDTAVFSDATGAPVYAAFCAISLEIAAPAAAVPGAQLGIVSRLRRLSAARLISMHDLEIGGQPFGTLTMISAFVRHGADRRNNAILRVQPAGRLDVVPMAPGEDQGFGARAAQIARLARSEPATGPDGIVLTPCPMTDFNAVGLLYCANYTALADRAEWALKPDLADLCLLRREIVFLGNIDPGVAVRVSMAPTLDTAHEIRFASPEGRPLARILTQKKAQTAPAA